MGATCQQPPRIQPVFHCVFIAQLRAGKGASAVILAASATVFGGQLARGAVRSDASADSVAEFCLGLFDLVYPLHGPTRGARGAECCFNVFTHLLRFSYYLRGACSAVILINPSKTRCYKFRNVISFAEKVEEGFFDMDLQNKWGLIDGFWL